MEGVQVSMLTRTDDATVVGGKTHKSANKNFGGENGSQYPHHRNTSGAPWVQPCPGWYASTPQREPRVYERI